MEDTGKTNARSADSSEVANGDQQSVVSRVGSLPLVSSACGVVSTAYTTTRDSVPLLKGVMDVAESGVRTLGAAATTGSKPILDRLEPQIAAVNEYAMKGLDKMEQNLPILQQPADKLVSDTVGMMYQSVFGAKDAMVGAMMGGVEMTRAVVSGGFSTVMGTRVGQMVSSGVGLVLTRSEDWVEHNLPLSEKELAELAEPGPSVKETPAVKDTPAVGSSYFVRLGKLSAKVQERALQLSLQRAQHARDSSYAAVGQISSTLDLLERARSASNQLGGAPEQLLQRWRDWNEGHPGEAVAMAEVDAGPKGETELEGRTLSMVRGMSDQLRTACLGVVSSAQGLPGVVQDQLANARQAAEDLQSSLGKTSSLTPVLLEQSRKHLKQVRHSLDGVMEYLLNNTPLNWLVGPFAPQVTEKGEGAQ
ncbi:mannose-6-phosphate receptor binding protein 1 isoform X2 [Osmerus eperlanus]|uniref:mannose-6-phosphate receptor binding protein 1 isoform X2 n=1 Tax=Osmerus eperlanus TaxID=29151 RepID=UPI002E141340